MPKIYSGTTPAHDYASSKQPFTNEQLERAFENLSIEDQLLIEKQVKKLTLHKNIGRVSALELLACLGIFMIKQDRPTRP